MKSMKYQNMDPVNLEQYITDPRYVFQQKLDGTNALVEVTEFGVKFYQANGSPLKHSACTQWFPTFVPDLVPLMQEGEKFLINAEIMHDSGTLWMFDLIEWSSNQGNLVTSDDPQDVRYAALTLVERRAGGTVRQVPQVDTEAQKRSLVANQDIEGVMIKDRYGKYEPGVRSNLTLKLKHVKTADVVVIDRNVGAENAILGVFGDQGELKQIGACSMIGKPDAQPGQVIEVAFLYFTSGQILYQPRMIRMRPDRKATSCELDQFSIYTKSVLSL